MLRLEGGDTGTSSPNWRNAGAEVMPGADWGRLPGRFDARLYAAEDTLFRVFTAFAVLAACSRPWDFRAGGLHREETHPAGSVSGVCVPLGDGAPAEPPNSWSCSAAWPPCWPFPGRVRRATLAGRVRLPHRALGAPASSGALVVILLITVLTVSWHAWRTSTPIPCRRSCYERSSSLVAMFTNHLRTALRSLFKDRLYTLRRPVKCNTGVACFVLVTAYVP